MEVSQFDSIPKKDIEEEVNENDDNDEDEKNQTVSPQDKDDQDEEGEEDNEPITSTATIEEPTIDPKELTPFGGNSLPYDLSTLTWDRMHRSNTQHTYCYCGKPKTRYGIMLCCSGCKQWFHLECLKHKLKNPPLHGDWAYKFKCCMCSGDNTESCELEGKNWTDIVRVAIWNLLVQEKKKGSKKRFFQYKDELCAFIDKNWDSLCYGKTRTKTWENTIGSSLSTKSHFFESGAGEMGQAGYWGLRSETDPSLIKDSGGVKNTLAKPVKKKKLPKKKRSISEALGTDEQSKQFVKVRKQKPTLPPLNYPRTFYDPWKRVPLCQQQMLVRENSAPQVKIGPDNLTVSNDKGYRTVKAAWGCSEGGWYYEVEILPHKGNTRVGWATEKGDVQAPVGYDKYGYSYRDKQGTIFHQSRGSPYGETYGPGDVVGFYIYLPPKQPSNAEGQLQPETKVEGDKPKDDDPKPLPGSEIMFFKNGVTQGVAFSDIFEGTYYPAASLYMGGYVRFNFGPTFKFPPQFDKKYLPMCNAVPSESEFKAREQQQQQQQQQQAQAAESENMATS